MSDVKWEKKQFVSYDPVALERQALGCIAKALAFRYGEQANCQSTVRLANGWVDRVQNELHEKLNVCAQYIRVKTEIGLGVSAYDSAGYDVELDYVRDVGRGRAAAFLKSLQESG